MRANSKGLGAARKTGIYAGGSVSHVPALTWPLEPPFPYRAQNSTAGYQGTKSRNGLRLRGASATKSINPNPASVMKPETKQSAASLAERERHAEVGAGLDAHREPYSFRTVANE